MVTLYVTRVSVYLPRANDVTIRLISGLQVDTSVHQDTYQTFLVVFFSLKWLNSDHAGGLSDRGTCVHWGDTGGMWRGWGALKDPGKTYSKQISVIHYLKVWNSTYSIVYKKSMQSWMAVWRRLIRFHTTLPAPRRHEVVLWCSQDN